MRTSIATRANLDLLDENYERWLQNPRSVDSDWAAFFEGFELGNLPPPNRGGRRSPGRFTANARRWPCLRVSHFGSHHRAPKPARGQASGKSAAHSARARLQRKRSRSSRFFKITFRQSGSGMARK